MCRLLGWATRTPTSLLDLLGSADLDAFTELSCKHADGWGMARSTAAGVAVRKRPDAARTSDDFTALAREERSDLGLAHLRWATLGLGVREENTHPFTDGRLAFAHNGSVAPPASLDRLLPRRVRRQRRGDTDSERYFLAVLARIRAGATPAQALTTVVGEIAASTRFTSLNCLLLTPEELYVVSRYDAAAPVRADEGPDYFSLRYRIGENSVVVASSGWGEGWQELGNGELMVVRRGSLEVSIAPLGELVRAA
jgi:predicted glutamine amidotransferase